MVLLMHNTDARLVKQDNVLFAHTVPPVDASDIASINIEYATLTTDIDHPSPGPIVPQSFTTTSPKKVFRAEEIAFRLTPTQPPGIEVKESDPAGFTDTAHPAEIARNASKWGIKSLKEKARLTYQAIATQNKNGTYPYDRYLKHGSNFVTIVETPVTNISKECIVWCTNLYLGLNRNPHIIEVVKSQLDLYGTGCGTSAVSGGFSNKHKELESEIAIWTGKEDAILYPTGFTTNLGAISTIATPNDLIIFDKECHASIIDGIKLSGAQFKTFRNNNPKHLETILEKINPDQFDNIFVLTEAVFGMTGEEAPIAKYCELKNKFPFLLYVDEAHSVGIYGKTGAGYCQHTGCSDQVDFIMGTLSKATASIGGFIACRKEFAAFLRISSNPYMFQACLPPADIIAAIEAIKIIKTTPLLQTKLWGNTRRFRDGLIQLGFNVGNGTSPIVPIFIERDDVLANVCKFLYSRGVYTNWIAYPAVKKNNGRLRFIVSAGHTVEQIEETLSILKEADKQFMIV